MDIQAQAEHQVKEAEKHYFTQLDLAAELLGHPHPRDPRHTPALETEKVIS